MNDKKNILITGESGFIGSHLIRHFVHKYPDYHMHGLDSLTYASNRAYTKDLEKYPHYQFHRVDICDREAIMILFMKYKFSDVIHLAAESHVDNSIHNPLLFAETNILGTLNLLDAFKEHSSGIFQHISTDEVYGDLKTDNSFFDEKSSYNPSSPYSASKASSDHFVQAYYRTYGLNTIITNCSNNYGPHQHAEKFIPTIIRAIIQNNQIPIYGNGDNIRDWLYVKDHVHALDSIFHKGKFGEKYNVGSNNEISNIALVKYICDLCVEKKYHKNPHKLISFVSDRLGHDHRYAINYTKLHTELNWSPQFGFEESLSDTIDWYVNQMR